MSLPSSSTIDIREETQISMSSTALGMFLRNRLGPILKPQTVISRGCALVKSLLGVWPILLSNIFSRRTIASETESELSLCAI